jgi:hypothetical protein
MPGDLCRSTLPSYVAGSPGGDLQDIDVSSTGCIRSNLGFQYTRCEQNVRDEAKLSKEVLIFKL